MFTFDQVTKQIWSGTVKSQCAYLCFRCWLQVAQPIAQPLSSQAELTILLLDAGHALENHFIILSRQNRLQSVHTSIDTVSVCVTSRGKPNSPTHTHGDHASPLITGDFIHCGLKRPYRSTIAAFGILNEDSLTCGNWLVQNKLWTSLTKIMSTAVTLFVACKVREHYVLLSCY